MMRWGLVFLLSLASACTSTGVRSSEDAERAYLSFDPSIDKAIQLAFDSFNRSPGPIIVAQDAKGNDSGTLLVSGAAELGRAQKRIYLLAIYCTYSDDGVLRYTSRPAVTLDLMLHPPPESSIDGTVDGIVDMGGALAGDVRLTLSFNGKMRRATDTFLERVPGTTHVTGTAVSAYGTYAVDVTR